MPVDIADAPDIEHKIRKLGCQYPLSGIALLPINFESAQSIRDLKQASEAATVKKLLVASHVPVIDVFEGRTHPPYIKNKSFGWTAPILFVSGALYSQNPLIVSVALNVLSSYAFEFFRGIGGNHNAQLDIIVEEHKRGTFKRISYKGPPEGIRELPEIVREALK